MSTNVNRRHFVKRTAGTAAAFLAFGGPQALAANEKIVLGAMGLGGRGTGLLEKFAGRKDIEIAWLCDPDTRRLGRASQLVEKVRGKLPRTSQDFRRILEDRSVDVLVNATPDHWHALGSILACQAGKDVYVEKPMAHSVWEGRKMIEAARKYQRVVQVGTQSRSGPYVKAAQELIRSGALGNVHLVRVFNMMQHPLVKSAPDQPPPEGFDYDLWCGPAAKLPYNPSRRWLNYREYSCGPIAGDAIHQLDLARFLMGDPMPPKTVSHNGGILSLKDGRDTPDTQIATFEYDNFTLLFEASLWSPYMHKIPVAIRDSDAFPEWPFCATRIELAGTKGIMFLGRHGGGWQAYDGQHKLIQQAFGRQADAEHIEDFLQCVRNRNRPAADVEQGHRSTMLCHLANAAWLAGNRKLAFDAQNESFPELPAANEFLKRPAYRTPWEIPDRV